MVSDPPGDPRLHRATPEQTAFAMAAPSTMLHVGADGFVRHDRAPAQVVATPCRTGGMQGVECL